MYIFHHLGLGDHIICNGMVRHFAEMHTKINLFCHDHYKTHIDYMFRDADNIEIIPWRKFTDSQDEQAVHNFLDSIEDQYIKIGFTDIGPYHSHYDRHQSGKTFDEVFYALAGLDFNIRYDKFFIERDTKKEQEVLSYLNPSKEPYIYVHDDARKGCVIDTTKHRSDLRVVKNNLKFNLFEMRGVLENAVEIHTMQTGMFDFCNSIVLEKPTVFVHKYVKNFSDFILSKGINPINTVL